jgi:hypothetical protein
MGSPKYQMIVGIAGTFTLLVLSSLIYRVYDTQNTEHLTYTWIFLILTAQSLLVLNNSYGIYLPAIVVISGISYILFVKVSNATENKIEMELIKKNIL